MKARIDAYITEPSSKNRNDGNSCPRVELISPRFSRFVMKWFARKRPCSPFVYSFEEYDRDFRPLYGKTWSNTIPVINKIEYKT